MDAKTVIKSLGGSIAVAKLLGYHPVRSGSQRVHNWIKRGIPSKVLLDHPHIFLRAIKRGN